MINQYGCTHTPTSWEQYSMAVPQTSDVAFDVFNLQTYTHLYSSIVQSADDTMLNNIAGGENPFILNGQIIFVQIIFAVSVAVIGATMKKIMECAVGYNPFNIYGPRHVKSAHQVMLVILFALHVAGSVSFYQQCSMPTPDWLSMYAFKACMRPIVTKLNVDLPAWFIVSLILGQLAVAACIPKFQDPLYQATPNILLALLILIAAVYLVEFIRRRAFLRSLVLGI